MQEGLLKYKILFFWLPVNLHISSGFPFFYCLQLSLWKKWQSNIVYKISVDVKLLCTCSHVFKHIYEMLQIEDFYLLKGGGQKNDNRRDHWHYHPVLFEKLKELFVYIITYLCSHGSWVDSGNRNAGGGEWKNGTGNGIGKQGLLVRFCSWPILFISWYQV